ncbi:MAG TPA: tRNA pseudouridine(38-40) synthase TruA [Candidatus Xenobia bacterium]
MSRTLRILLEYDGTAFHGFQRQNSGVRTVQGTLEELLTGLLGESIRVIGAGRTDAGVHALGQVVSFKTTSERSTRRIQRAINGLMHGDLVARSVDDAAPDFDARRSASSRRYQYLVFNDDEPLSVMRHHAWHVFRPLEVERMREASAGLVGRHDFRSFSSQASHLHQTRRTVTCTDVREVARTDAMAVMTRLEEGRTLAFDVEAEAFLPHMVRMMVGTLVRIGTGEWPPHKIRELLERPQDGAAGPPAPPQGLCLLHVRYRAAVC